MLDVTDRHFRYFMRLITKSTLLYTEMITSMAILRGDPKKLLTFSPEEVPVALQLAGDNPEQLAESAQIGEAYGYSEINLNVGCPSDRVQQASFGACLMAKPELVARIVQAIKEATPLPVTVKHRIGIDHLNRYKDLARFVRIVSEAGCDRFIVHARVALLNGLSPKENRSVPPLRYDDVYRLKQDFPHLIVELNGGVKTLIEAQSHLRHVDGVMIGRAAYENPYMFALADALFYHSDARPPSRREVVENFIPYMKSQAQNGVPVQAFKRPLMSLFTGMPRSRIWRRYLTEVFKSFEQIDTLAEIMDSIFSPDVLDERPKPL